jgi:uroporphyrinogen decarboxylase
MNSRGRVIAAIKRRGPDRVPIDLGGTYASTIHATAYYNLLNLLNIDKPVRIADTMQLLVHIDEEIVNRFSFDVKLVWTLKDLLGVRRDKGFKDWITPTGTPVKISSDFNPARKSDGSYIYKVGDAINRLPADGFYFDTIKPAFGWIETVKDVEKIEIPIMDEEEKEWLKNNAERARKETDKFIVADILGGWCDIAGPMLGNQKFYMDIISNKPMIHALFEKLNEVWMKRIDVFVETVGDSVDAVPVYNDLGCNMGGLYDPKTVREMIIPYIKKFYEHVRRVSNYYIIFHACGSVYQYLPDLIDAGVDILNPVQVGVRYMDPEKLKKQFGRDLTFWGGAVNPQDELSFGSPQKVRERAKHNMMIFKEGGGFIYTQPHNIQANVPPENVVALFETAKEFGNY